jgi:hypothetical protein
MGEEVPAVYVALYVVAMIVGAYLTFIRGWTMFGSEAAAFGVSA